MGDLLAREESGEVRVGEWDTYAICPCGLHFRLPFGDVFHIHRRVCPRCGTHKRSWVVRVCRWVSEAVWWRPSTWGRGHWENKEAERDA